MITNLCVDVDLRFKLSLYLSARCEGCQVVKMLIAVVTIFATLWLPHRGMLVYNTVAALVQWEGYMDLWFLMFAKTCIYINR